MLDIEVILKVTLQCKLVKHNSETYLFLRDATNWKHIACDVYVVAF